MEEQFDFCNYNDKKLYILNTLKKLETLEVCNYTWNLK